MSNKENMSLFMNKHFNTFTKIVLITGISIIFCMLSIVSASAYEEFGIEWNEKALIQLSNSTLIDNYQIHLTSDNFLIPSYMFDIMNHEGNDTRFTNINETEIYYFWIEKINSRNDYSIWINIENQTDNFYWHYDNTDAIIQSDGINTFTQFKGEHVNTSYIMPFIIEPFNYSYHIKIYYYNTLMSMIGMFAQYAALPDSSYIYSSTVGTIFYQVNNNSFTEVGRMDLDVNQNDYNTYQITNYDNVSSGYINNIHMGDIITNLPDTNLGMIVEDYMSYPYNQEYAFVRKYYPLEPILNNITLINEPFKSITLFSDKLYNNQGSNITVYESGIYLKTIHYGESLLINNSRSYTFLIHEDIIDQITHIENLDDMANNNISSIVYVLIFIMILSLIVYIFKR